MLTCPEATECETTAPHTEAYDRTPPSWSRVREEPAVQRSFSTKTYGKSRAPRTETKPSCSVSAFSTGDEHVAKMDPPDRVRVFLCLGDVGRCHRDADDTDR